ncbi:MAG: TetR/AcrR family transcriptional regulator [Mycobacteriales bacterium]|jgi:AcrR family transcriptional regulator
MDQQPGPPAAPGGTRELILDAARAEIAALGYDAATVRSIARRAGVDPRLVRYYFADKRGLATVALGEFDLVAALSAEEGDLCSRLEAVWDRYPVAWRAQLAGAASDDPEVRAAFLAATKVLVEWACSPEDDPDGMQALLAFAQLIGIWMICTLAPDGPADEQRRTLLQYATSETMRRVRGLPPPGAAH